MIKENHTKQLYNAAVKCDLKQKGLQLSNFRSSFKNRMNSLKKFVI